MNSVFSPQALAVNLTVGATHMVKRLWNATQTVGQDFRWQKHAKPRFETYFPYVLLAGNLYLFSVLIYKQYFYEPALNRAPSPNVVRQIGRVWNLVWSLFSALGCYGVYGLLPMANSYGDASGSAGFWIFMYCWTKPLELIDTYLLMLSGREIRLVHWSHHNITMIFTWYAALNFLKPSVIFAFTNFGVHALMYGYYFLVSYPMFRSALKNYAFLVTWIQMAQFVVCLGSMFVFYDKYENSDLVVSATMYLYYLILFVQMYRERFRSKFETR